VVLAGGGTGGHVYPGLTIAGALGEELRARGQDLALLYIGIRGRVDERVVPASGIPFRAISAGPLRVSSPLAFVANSARLAFGVGQSLRLLRSFRPDVVFATGGYASVPVGVAARLLRRPLVVFLPDVTPGLAVRLLSRLATRMATTSERALDHLPRAKTTVVGYPVRPEFWSTERAAARRALGLPEDAKLLLVAAGSLGATRINDAVIAALPELLAAAHVMHVTGADDERRALDAHAALPHALRGRYTVRPYLQDMASAMHAADLFVGRAGASTLGELPAAGLPAVLVPGEYEGWSQAPNAEYLQERGAAVMLRNTELERLASTVRELLADDARLARMREAMRTLARPEAARDLARVVIDAAQGRGG